MDFQLKHELLSGVADVVLVEMYGSLDSHVSDTFAEQFGRFASEGRYRIVVDLCCLVLRQSRIGG